MTLSEKARAMLGFMSPQTVWNAEVICRLDTRTLEYRWLLEATVSRHVMGEFEATIGDRPIRTLTRRPTFIEVEVSLESLADARHLTRAGGPFASARVA